MRDLIYSPSAEVVPIEDLKPGMTVHGSQLTEPHPDKVYAAARKGLTYQGIAVQMGMATDSLCRHYPKTIAKARSDFAAELLDKLRKKADDDDEPGDLRAVEMLLRRLDPEPKEAAIQVNQQINVFDKFKDISIDQINSLLIDAEYTEVKK